MPDPQLVPEPVAVQLARIDGRLENIEQRLGMWTQCRHVTPEGDCDFRGTVAAHEIKIAQWAPLVEKIDEHEKCINQWTGALTVVGILSAFIGGLIGALSVLLGWKR